MTFAMIIALGPNDIEVPCMSFATIAEARAFLIDNIGDRSRILKKDFWTVWHEKDFQPVSELFFTSYYGGCGHCGCYTVREVTHGQMITAWDMD